jgi:hypothetical protein
VFGCVAVFVVLAIGAAFTHTCSDRDKQRDLIRFEKLEKEVMTSGMNRMKVAEKKKGGWSQKVSLLPLKKRKRKKKKKKKKTIFFLLFSFSKIK